MMWNFDDAAGIKAERGGQKAGRKFASVPDHS